MENQSFVKIGNKVRCDAVDSLKFILSVIIVYYHLFYANIKPYIGETELFRMLAPAAKYSGLAVECFLVIAGYFIYMTWKKGRTGFSDFALTRWVRLWPVFAFYVVLVGLQTKFRLEDVVLDLCFLRCTGISLAFRGIVWYIGPFFWASLLVYAVLSVMERGKALLTIALMVYFCYAVNVNVLSGGLGREVRLEFISMGMLRVLGGLSVGVLLGAAKEAFSRKPQTDNFCGRGKFFVISVVEILSFGLLMYHFLVAKLFGNGVTTVILFSVLFLCLLSSGGLITRLLSWKWLAYAGRYCYSIYVMQQVAFYAMARGYWKSHAGLMQEYPGWSVVVAMVVTLLIGVATYYLVEVPALILYRRWKKSI